MHIHVHLITNMRTIKYLLAKVVFLRLGILVYLIDLEIRIQIVKNVLATVNVMVGVGLDLQLMQVEIVKSVID